MRTKHLKAVEHGDISGWLFMFEMTATIAILQGVEAGLSATQRDKTSRIIGSVLICIMSCTAGSPLYMSRRLGRR